MLTEKWLLFTQLCLLKDLVIRCVRQFIRRAKSMLLSQNVVVAEPPAEISSVPVVDDVKSSQQQQDLNTSFQIAQVRIHDSVCIEIPLPEETPLLGSVKTCSVASTAAIEENGTEFVPKISSGSYADKDSHFPLLSTVSLMAMRVSLCSERLLLQKWRDLTGAYKLADLAMEDESIVSGSCGTTALTALVIGRHLMVANAGDCRAVLCRKGKAVDMSFDHKSTFEPERRRVEELGGYFEGEYLYGELAVTRALGDWSVKRYSSLGVGGGSFSPLISDPEIKQTVLTEEDEF
ncbi:hypothetical protein Bca52824_025816 [Brassica carinata]|uniref:PPM-type phosphatase domain-containing protein n=1 Tax=Brassica carinata TaxID=52824 RepID=A0A8X7SF50_BRACI|nr:hypothetical protein Bca52824_025816 [Brassica carinata]